MATQFINDKKSTQEIKKFLKTPTPNKPLGPKTHEPRSTDLRAPAILPIRGR